jgi:hypothetical protein
MPLQCQAESKPLDKVIINTTVDIPVKDLKFLDAGYLLSIM